MHSWRYHAFRSSAVAGSSTIASARAADLLHLLVVAVVVRLLERLDGHLRQVAVEQLHHPIADALGDVGPAVVDEVLIGEAAALQRGEVHQPLALPARLQRGEPVRIDRVVVARVDGRRRALEDVQLPGVAPERRDALHGGRPGADDADALVGELRHRSALVAAAGVVVVPPGGVERVPAEAVQPGHARQLRTVQRPRAHGDVLGGDPVAPVGGDEPVFGLVVPRHRRDVRREDRLRVQVVVLGDPLGVPPDLRRHRVLLRRHVPRLLEERQVDHRRRVAHRAGVAVPVPHTAEVAAALDDPDVVDARLVQPPGDAQPGEPAADHEQRDVLDDRSPARRAACTGRRVRWAKRPVGSTYCATPSGRRRLSRSSR